MYFKQLEIVGFKSFPHKTKLKFEPGITAVVGPNGCGKSNISDAIRWVLGEQSPKSLRGSSMNDVIFNGTDAVEPINMAEVTLTLSNEKRLLPIDYNEVTITRRLFRSGESEYVLNKTPVRLKDISQLLMGTGMGTSSYSIIEQGKIDLILSSKPEERRYIFEEASGITRYKSKKREALRKLEHTENNLVRINDIINEVKRQINSIERHAKKAERYKHDFEIMKEMELRFTSYELRNINSKLDGNRDDLAKERMSEKKLMQEIKAISEAINKHREEVDASISELTQAQKDLSEARLFIDKGSHKVELNSERVSDLKNIKENAIKESVALKEKTRLAEEEIERIKDRLRGISKEKDEKEKLLLHKESAKKELSRRIDEHQRDIKNAKTKSVDLLASQTRIKNELIKLGADLQNRKSRLRRLESEKKNVEAEKTRMELLYKEAAAELENCDNKVSRRKKIQDEFKNRFHEHESALEDTRKRITESENEINALRSKEELLREMIEKLEGFDKGVKIIAEGVKTGILSGVMGIIANLVEPEKGYEVALETALGNKSQAVVVRDKNALREALHFIKERGRVPFIIYDDMKNAVSKSRNGLFTKVSEKPLSSFVKTDPLYRNIIDFLLANTYMVDTAEEAYEKQSGAREGTRFVTKDGFLTEKGFIFGGASTNATDTSIIGRANRLKDSESRKERLSGSMESLRKGETLQKENLEKIKEEILSVADQLKKEEIALANVKSRKESIETDSKKVNEEFSVIGLETGEVMELIQEISLRGNDLNKRLNENEGEYNTAQESIAALQALIEENTKSKNDLILEISELNSGITFLGNTKQETEKNLQKEASIFDDLNSRYESKLKDIEDSDNKIRMLVAESESLEEEIRKKKDDESTLSKKLDGISENKNKFSQSLREKESASREKEKILENLRNQIRNAEISHRESELTVINIKDRIREAYKVDITQLEVQIDDNANWEDIKNQIEVLRIKLDKLGPVNLVAIEEHKELEERHAFLTEQQEDLIRAKESLHKAITKINKTTRALFIESFGKIQVEFRNYFRMLFGGGHAELLLMDENDVLESGIEIVVRPPGKKLQNLLLLSGGEKALTAIALLFAIFKVKPSPFCILDEVDAPLDESNIGRFTRILGDFLKTSQFIVITHSKKTMQMANILYGITMEKKGVSKIVSVKFAEDDEKSSEKEEALV